MKHEVNAYDYFNKNWTLFCGEILGASQLESTVEYVKYSFV